MAFQILRRRDVEAVIGLRRSQLYAMIQRGEFPKPVKLGNGPTGAVGWVRSEVDEWLSRRIAARDSSIPRESRKNQDSAFAASK